MTTRYRPVGPFDPPTPSEAESEIGEPMAVARDKQQTHGESFVATTAPLDAYSDEIARLYRQVPASAMLPRSHDANRAAETPPGFSEVDARGWRRLVLEREEPE